MALLILILLFLFSSCSQIGYLYEVSTGQIGLLWNAKRNDEILSSPNISREHKDKIQKIINYKKYFYSYFEKKPTKIYSKTTILKGKAVTELVVASPKTKIEAKKFCFPFAGCFPYQGFFKTQSANVFIKKLQEEGYSTYKRPVYAYSTLGNFNDPILSSFFYYSDYDLAELVFHELFHTVFFIEDEVDLNENFANFFGKKMARQFFEENNFEIKSRKNSVQSNNELRRHLVKLTNDLQGKYKAVKNIDAIKAQRILKRFNEKTFRPSIKRKCKELNIQNCYPLGKKEWNNARYAAYLTYEEKMEKISNFIEEKKMSLKELLSFLQRIWKDYDQDDKGHKTFEEYLFKVKG